MATSRVLVPTAVMVVLACATSRSLGQVSNSGFEVGDLNLFTDFNYFPNTFASWTNVPDRLATNVIEQVQGAGFIHSGSFAAKVYGQFNGGPNASLVTQSIAAVPGNLYDLSAWAMTSTADPITGIGVAFMSISFRNASNTVLEITTYDVLDETSVQDLYTQTAFSATAPVATATATIELGYFQLDNSVTGSAFYDDASLVSAGPNTGLINPGWDSYVPTVDFQPAPCCIPGWTKPGGGNGYINNSNSQTGNTALIFYGNFNGQNNTTVVYQNMPVTPGQLVEASSVVGQVSGDVLELDNAAFMNLEFRDVSDNLLENTRLTMLRAGGPVDVFTPGSVLATAPAGATTARIQFGFFQSSAIVPGQAFQGRGAAYFDNAALDFLGINDGLINPSFDTFYPGADFEPDPERPLPGWSTAGFNGGVAPTDPNIGQSNDSNTGEFAAYMFGQFPGDNSQNDSVVYQDLPASAGAGVQVDMVAMHLSTDPISASNGLALNIEWLTAGNSPLGYATTSALSSVSPQDVYLPVTVSGVAPTGTAKARIAIVYTQVNEGTGAAFFDDVSVSITPPAPCVGDITGDGLTNSADFNILASNFGNSVTPSTNGDLTGDGLVNSADFNILAGDFGCGS